MVQENISPEDMLNFPDGSELIVEEILKTYGLEKNHREGLDSFLNTLSPKERQKIIRNLPGVKIGQLLRMVKNNKLELDNLPKELEKNLNISTEDSKKMAQILNEKLLICSKPIIKETPKKETPNVLKRQDIYREPMQ